MTKSRRSPAPPEFDPEFVPNFVPVPVKHRADGWTSDRQVAFVEALGQSGCVTEAASAVGMSVRSAYALRQHSGAAAFRAAWEAALDFAIKRLSDAALSRAINGVARPVIYKGEVVGERRYYDERLTQFLLRYRDPITYGKWRDTMTFEQVEDGAAKLLAILSVQLARGGEGRNRAADPHVETQEEREEREDIEHYAELDRQRAAGGAKVHGT